MQAINRGIGWIITEIRAVRASQSGMQSSVHVAEGIKS